MYEGLLSDCKDHLTFEGRIALTTFLHDPEQRILYSEKAFSNPPMFSIVNENGITKDYIGVFERNNKGAINLRKLNDGTIVGTIGNGLRINYVAGPPIVE